MTEKTMTEKDMFLQTWQREFETTVKVLRAYPAGKDDFRPAEKSRTARELAWTLVTDEDFATAVAEGKLDTSQGMPPTPAAPVSEIIGTYEKSHGVAASKVRGLGEEAFHRMVPFPVAPGKMGEVRVADLLWLTVMDMVHHRGQFSVYLRIVGAKVPSIYGPTADEPWV